MMGIKQEPFTKYNEEKKVDSFTVRLNKEEREQLEQDKKILEQVKDSTAIKQLASIGSKVIHEEKIRKISDIILGNKRKNKRLGINDFD